MLRRTVAPLLSLGVLMALATGCTGAPDPVETTPGFSTEEEAFAAAEETYRAYVDALNQVDLADPETFEPVYALTTGEANANERGNLSQMHADGWQVSGETEILTFTRASEPDASNAAVVAVACTDVSAISVVDASGASRTAPDRADVYALELQFSFEGDSLKVAASNAIEDPSCVDS